jgi:hypothetical protein
MYKDPMREHCDKLLEQMQKNPEFLNVDIVGPAMFMSVDKLIEYVDYLRRAYN